MCNPTVNESFENTNLEISIRKFSFQTPQIQVYETTMLWNVETQTESLQVYQMALES